MNEGSTSHVNCEDHASCLDIERRRYAKCLKFNGMPIDGGDPRFWYHARVGWGVDISKVTGWFFRIFHISHGSTVSPHISLKVTPLQRGGWVRETSKFEIRVSKFFFGVKLEVMVEDFIDMPPEVALARRDITRDEARELTKALVREAELDEEALAPSSIAHIETIASKAVKDAIRALEQDNAQLIKRMTSGDMYADDGITPTQARQLFKENTKLLAELQTSMAKAKGATSANTSLTVDVGSIFQQALDVARETAEIETEICQK